MTDSSEPVLNWYKSTHSAKGECVQVADLGGGGKAVRDSKLGDGSPVLSFTKGEWDAFLAGARDGEFDNP